MKNIFLTIPLLLFIISVKGQTKDSILFTTGCNCIPRYNYLDTIHHDKKSDFTVIGKDTIRNGIYEFNFIKRRLKKKEVKP